MQYRYAWQRNPLSKTWVVVVGGTHREKEDEVIINSASRIDVGARVLSGGHAHRKAKLLTSWILNIRYSIIE